MYDDPEDYISMDGNEFLSTKEYAKYFDERDPETEPDIDTDTDTDTDTDADINTDTDINTHTDMVEPVDTLNRSGDAAYITSTYLRTYSTIL